MALTLIWKKKRMTVRFTRDSHRTGGCRSNKIDFSKFAVEVGFRKNQGYSVFQVPRLGDPAFEFEKAWEVFPKADTFTLPDDYGSPMPGSASHQGPKPDFRMERGEYSGTKLGSSDALVWHRSIAAKKTTKGSFVLVKKAGAGDSFEAGDGKGTLRIRKDAGRVSEAGKKRKKEGARDKGNRT